MKQYDFTFKGELSLDGAEDTLLDKVCEELNSNVKETKVSDLSNEFYRNLAVELENGIEIDCEISRGDTEWKATVWQFD